MSSNPVWVTAAVGLALFAGAVPRGGRDSEARVDVVRHEAERRVDILIDGKPFTAYRYGDASVKKPILYPLRSARGTVITRGFRWIRARANAPIIRIRSGTGSTMAR